MKQSLFRAKPGFKIAVAGAADIGCCAPGAVELAKEVGQEIARQGCILVTGATTGIPHFAAQGAKQEQGVSIGFSPAVSQQAHVKSYHLPVEFFDIIVYTGFDYAGRNLLMTRAADGVVIVCGRMGTLNEFTIAYEDEKPIGVLQFSGGMADRLDDIVTGPQRAMKKIVFEKNPRKLVQKLIAKIKKEKKVN